jgi:hypothetical protein
VSEDKLLETFYNTFRGNDDFYIKHQAPFLEEEGGKVKSPWVNFVKYTEHNPPPEGKEIGDFAPVTRALYKGHLNGGDGLAIAPITNTKDKKNVCYYAAIDIDIYSANFTGLVQRLRSDGFKFAAFLSKSGGLHIYFFFRSAEPAAKAAAALEKIVEAYGLAEIYKKGGERKVEIFPKQTSIAPGGGAGCLLLPFYNAAHPDECRTKMLTAEGKLIGIAKALPLIKEEFSSLKELNAVIGALPYSDAPYCVQTILLSGVLGVNGGRNNFLFSAAVYLKKKYKDGFKERLQEMNDRLEAPLEQRDIDSIYTSVTTHSYDGYGCNKPPGADYCDKKQCALREYGVGKLKNNRLTGADCWGEIIKYEAGEGEDSYYVWNIRVSSGGGFEQVRIDGAADLQNQLTVQRQCLRYLDWMPLTVKQNDWALLVSKALEGVREKREGSIVKVPRSADTTEMSRLRECFLRFLTHRQMQSGQVYKIKMGQVYYADGAYYFDSKGLLDYLHVEKQTVRSSALIDFLVKKQQCEQDAELQYTTPKGEVKSLRCWKKPETDELREMGSFFEDVYEGDADILRKNKLNKEQEGGGGDDGVKF